ncbi:SGNH hydrolase [Glarea lozoyensis ATCC 20868]|uniref:SGNH hydrolase n=1 Tax=Glarea lozoyensis (strain ATCC 20868 / MF5171) TaxID=1116229 RepID=S3DGQ2_GLAL2|nr:SGNH hydrolase [Glarea lozoyensis ATCC 20868]EPE31216.1 SGNH hydrolase [Glarea lozoyensis ATCC 20868]
MFNFAKSMLLAVSASVLNPVLGAATVRINALGDSITGSPGCWRALLWQQLQNANIKNTDFVGTLAGQGCGFTYDGENDGHGGFLATGIVKNNQLPGWLSISKPDIVMMELGTNDVWSHLPTETIVAALTKLVDQMRSQKPTMRVLVAQITPMNPSGCSDCNQGVINLNKAVVAWAPTKSTAASPISVVDCFTGFNTATDTNDGVHPNNSGNAKLANCWFTPLKAAIALAGGNTTTVIPSASTNSKR